MKQRYPQAQQIDASHTNPMANNQPPRPQTVQGSNTATAGIANPFAFAQQKTAAPTEGTGQRQGANVSQVTQSMNQMNMTNQNAAQPRLQQPGHTQLQQNFAGGAQTTAPMQYGGGQNTGQAQTARVEPFEGEAMDELSADKSLLRVTTDRIPFSNALQKDLGIPLALLIKPFGELPSGEEVPTANFQNKPIVRCRECRAYVNPFIKFIDNGARWICNFCKLDNTTESYYYSQLDQTGQRVDFNSRPELYSGSVDFLASSEYMNRPPMPPTFVFLLDVSQQAVESGYLQQACSTIKGVIEEGTLPGGERTRVAFLAYDKNLYYFNLRSTLKQPQMMVVPELSENYLPQPDDLLVNLNDSYEIICTMLDSFQNYFTQPNGSVMDTAVVPAITSAFNICKHIGGRMLLFQVSIAIQKMPELQPKQGAEQNAGDKFSSSNQFFSNTASELAHSQVSVDLFVFTVGKGVFKNLQTMADLARFSNGNLFYYNDYEYYQSGLKFTNELYNSLTRSCGWEAVFRVRTSSGFSQIGTYGNKIIKQKTADLILCPVIDKDRILVYELERENSDSPEKRRLMTDQKHMFVQSALLYSTAEGERRIRVHNAAIPLTNIATLPYDYLDTSALALYWARSAIARSQINQGNFGSVQTQLEIQLQSLCRNQARAALQAGIQQAQGELPEALQYLALYMFGLLKTPLVSPVTQLPPRNQYFDMIADLKFQMNSMSPEEVVPYFYPQIYNISNPQLTDAEFPPLEMLQRESLTGDQIYLGYNALNVFILVGPQADPSLIQAIYKVESYAQINMLLTEEEMFADVESSPYLTALYSLINQVRYQRQPFCPLRTLIQGEKTSESALLQLCVLSPQQHSSYTKDYNRFMQEMTPKPAPTSSIHRRH